MAMAPEGFLVFLAATLWIALSLAVARFFVQKHTRSGAVTLKVDWIREGFFWAGIGSYVCTASLIIARVATEVKVRAREGHDVDEKTVFMAMWRPTYLVSTFVECQ